MRATGLCERWKAWLTTREGSKLTAATVGDFITGETRLSCTLSRPGLPGYRVRVRR